VCYPPIRNLSGGSGMMRKRAKSTLANGRPHTVAQIIQCDDCDANLMIRPTGTSLSAAGGRVIGLWPRITSGGKANATALAASFASRVSKKESSAN
jgi:hypothetical protein